MKGKVTQMPSNRIEYTTLSHVQGANRHTDYWEKANKRAVAVLERHGIYTMAGVMPQILLEVLDGIREDDGLHWDRAMRCWRR